MFYRLRRNANVARLNRGIAGIFKTSPLTLRDAPWCIVSMVADRDVPMYLVAIKAFYSRVGRGKVTAIIDRDMSQVLRDTLTYHVPGIEFVILEDIPTDPCQRGGTWERLLYCLDRSKLEFTMQLDADMLAVGENLSEVLDCAEQNRAFTMSDGFYMETLDKTAEIARATPSSYIGIVAEACMSGLPHSASRHYIRGSSGFAGFAKDGYSREEISAFHEDMEALVGHERWREWGSEQCGSNFAIANSPNPLILPYPEYSSFTRRALRHKVKLFHFIGRFRFVEGYYLRRALEVISALTPGAKPVPLPQPTFVDNSTSNLLTGLTVRSMPVFIKSLLKTKRDVVTVQMKRQTAFRDDPSPGPLVTLRGGDLARHDTDEATDVFARLSCIPPVWIPPERVELIVDLFSGIGMSCVWWLANYWRAQVIAAEPDPTLVSRLAANITLNGFSSRLTMANLAPIASENARAILDSVQGRRIDILRIDMATHGAEMLDDPAFLSSDIGAISLLHYATHGYGGQEWLVRRLEEAGFIVYVPAEGRNKVVWGFRAPSQRL